MTRTWCPECEVTFEGASCPFCRFSDLVHEEVKGFDIREERKKDRRVGLAENCPCLIDRETGKVLEECTAHRRRRERN